MKKKRRRPKPFDLVPPGSFCEHRHMRYTSCESCRKKKITCAVECPDCQLHWMLNEGVNG
jgi:hypothetical protein